MRLLHTIEKVLACRREVTILRAQVERLKVERDRIRDERDLMARRLAVEQGIASAAPSEGWSWTLYGCWLKTSGPWTARVQRLPDGSARWMAWKPAGPSWRETSPCTYDAMVAADLAVKLAR